MKTLKILVVEDNVLILKCLQHFFASLDLKIETATTVLEAIRLVEDNHYQLIVSDIGLPDGNGVELVEQVRALEKKEYRKGAYICGSTAFNLNQYKRICEEVGFNELTSKPMSIDMIQRLIAQVS